MHHERQPRPTWKARVNSGLILLVVGVVLMLISWLVNGQVAWDSLGLIFTTLGAVFLVVGLVLWLVSRRKGRR